MSYFNDVGRFHRKFDLPVTGDRPPAMLAPDVFRYRLQFMQEELDEFVTAHLEGDLEATLDALVDLAWVAMGTAHFLGAPFDEGWQEVVRANMEKERGEADGAHKRGVAEVIRKPSGWRPPDHARVLADHRRRLFGDDP